MGVAFGRAFCYKSSPCCGLFTAIPNVAYGSSLLSLDDHERINLSRMFYRPLIKGLIYCIYFII